MGSPVVFKDPSGLRKVRPSNIDIDEDYYGRSYRYVPIPGISCVNLLYISPGYIISKLVLAAKNYKHNSEVDSGKYSTRNRLLNDQKAKTNKITTGSLFRYGLYNVSYNGCEAIAVHNAKVLAKYDSTLSDTIFDFETSVAEVGYGVFGSDPRLIGLVLKRENINFGFIKSMDDIGTGGTYILSFWAGEGGTPPIHTVAYKDGILYNFKGEGGLEVLDRLEGKWKTRMYDHFICGYVIYDNPNYNPNNESSGGKYWGDPPCHTHNRI